MCQSDRPRSRSRSPIGNDPTVQTGSLPLRGTPPKKPTMSDVDEFEFFLFCGGLH